ncbi:hypothetical protein TNCV_2053931 [Trichonephila clavipes]|nr:hypothetical protein TNCV_2053931 [Trichonephila clavipes]
MVMVMNSCPVFEPWYHKSLALREELMHVKHVEVKCPHDGVMWKFGRGVISSGVSSSSLSRGLKLRKSLVERSHRVDLECNINP